MSDTTSASREPRPESPVQYPYTCPVCGGRGSVQFGFYDLGTASTSTAADRCRTCFGAGVIWRTLAE